MRGGRWACAVVCALLGCVTLVAGRLMPQLLTGENFGSKVTSGGRWFVQFHDPGCEICQTLTPRFRKVARSLLKRKEVQFGKFNCEAEYNEAFCDMHGIREKPTYVLFDEFRTTGHRFNPKDVPSANDMKLWLVDCLQASNVTQSFHPLLEMDLDMTLDWHHPDSWAPPEQGSWEVEEKGEQDGVPAPTPRQQDAVDVQQGTDAGSAFEEAEVPATLP